VKKAQPKQASIKLRAQAFRAHSGCGLYSVRTGTPFLHRLV